MMLPSDLDPYQALPLDVAAVLAFPNLTVTGSKLKEAAAAGHLRIWKAGGTWVTTLNTIEIARPTLERIFAPEPDKTFQPIVYVVGFGPYIKIGYTDRYLRYRLRELQTGCPETLQIYAVIQPGSAAMELELHQQFRHLQLRGEWFKKADELLDRVCNVANVTDFSKVT